MSASQLSRAPGADRNLLFGILAVQNDFISEAALLAAMRAWLHDKSKSLGQLLGEQGALSPERLRLLEALVDEHLRAHGDDPQRSLRALVPQPPTEDERPDGDGRPASRQARYEAIYQELVGLGDADLADGLAAVATVCSLGPPADAAGERPANGTAGPAPALRYRRGPSHARGGLGEVFLAEDEELHRTVALKEMQPEQARNEQGRRRFVVEAEVTGRLEHPGIVPVYGLGHYPDGRPYYAMRFIQGEPLSHAIQRFHGPDVPGRDTGEQRPTLRELLGRFVAVCNAVAYAHSRGIVHRDIKPANVMLGKYGETLVVDWGLAKVVGRPEAAQASEEATVRPVSGEGLEETRAGAALGTPAFMSPEQAEGRWDRLGPASDIYSLGATLYVLLTGQVAFRGKDLDETLAKVKQGQFPRPRQVKKQVPRALEAICLKAMAHEPGERYQTALALAADVEHWLADEAVSAWREPWHLRAARWARRHQARVAATAAGVLVAVLAGGAGAWQFQRQQTERRAEAARQEESLRQDIAAVEQLVRQERWGEAREVLDRVEARLGTGGPSDLKERLARARKGLDLVEQLEATGLKRVDIPGQFDLKGLAKEYEGVFQTAGIGESSGDTTAAVAWVVGSGVRGPIVAALDDWALSTPDPEQRIWLWDVARQADPGPWQDTVRNPVVWRNPETIARLVEDDRAAEQSPRLLALLCNQLMARGGRANGRCERHSSDTQETSGSIIC